MTQNNNKMFSDLAAAGWGNSRNMLLEYIQAMQREACALCSPQCPFVSHNIFERLYKAVLERDKEAVLALLVRMSELGVSWERAQEIAEEMQVVLVAFPTIWGGDPLDEAEE